MCQLEKDRPLLTVVQSPCPLYLGGAAYLLLGADDAHQVLPIEHADERALGLVADVAQHGPRQPVAHPLTQLHVRLHNTHREGEGGA
jgi:hypothetical protein